MKKLYLAFNILICLFAVVQVQAQYTKLLDFKGTGAPSKDGRGPQSSLILSGNVLYGMTQFGGANDMGSIFKMAADGSWYTKLWNFNGTNGSSPFGALTLSGNYLYGATHSGGAHGKGTIFSIDTFGLDYKVLLDFDGSNTGAMAHGPLILSGSVLYGETHAGGTYGFGCVFKINTNGSGYTKLLDFDGLNGNYPGNSITLSDSVLYGITMYGGTSGVGCIYKINTNGSGYKKLWDFDTINGSYPTGYLVLSGNILYGTTKYGGTSGDGCIYKINTDGSGYKKLWDFYKINGRNPWSVCLSGNVLYGITATGGANDLGCMYKINTDGSGYCKFLDFDGTNNGSIPQSDLALYGKTLYGNTQKGGTSDFGVVFKYNIPPFLPCDTLRYTLVVNNGTGSGNYTDGKVVNITADTAPAGKVFYRWTGNITTGIADLNSPNTTITMPAANDTLTPTYTTNYVLTVNSGTGSGFYTAGTVVDVKADAPPEGKVFSKWTGDIAGITNVNASSTTFTMPDSNATITATYDTVIVITSAFSPNSDGVNDSWHIKDMDDPTFVGEVKVFNRWGQLVYDYSKTHKYWYGYDLSGTKLPVESYYYYIDYKNGKKPIKGIVTIVR